MSVVRDGKEQDESKAGSDECNTRQIAPHTPSKFIHQKPLIFRLFFRRCFMFFQNLSQGPFLEGPSFESHHFGAGPRHTTTAAQATSEGEQCPYSIK